MSFNIRVSLLVVELQGLERSPLLVDLLGYVGIDTLVPCNRLEITLWQSLAKRT
jgi:hypothetical protein